MKESKVEIMERLEKENLNAILFLQSVDHSTYENIVLEAEKERNEKDVDFCSLLGIKPIEIESEKEEQEVPFDDFIRHVSYRIQCKGTEIWLRKLKKEACENIINGLHGSMGLDCKITLGNGDSFDEWKLAREWEEMHGETLEKKGDWSVL